eukprot:1179122-Prorocentrum_minimum.AAC.1
MLLPSRSLPAVDVAPVALHTSRRCCSRRAPYQSSMLLPSRSLPAVDAAPVALAQIVGINFGHLDGRQLH